MITITKKLKRNNFQPQTFRVYTKAEAKGEGLKWKHWGEAQEGQYGISDDGYVAECIYRKEYGDKVEYTYPYGRQWLTAWGKLEFEPHWRSNNFSTVSTKSYNDLEVQKKGADLAMDAYIAYKMAGLSPDWEKIGRLYRPDQDNPVIAAKRLFKTKQVKKMIQDKLKDILIDKNIYNLYFSKNKIKNKKILKIESHEKNKNLKTIEKILKFFVKNNISKSNKIYAIGGGIIQDLAGYSCSIYKRGLYWEYIPTTFLGMTDSCVGGKVGINFGEAKNLVALFSAPRKVKIDVTYLNSLSKEDLLSGLGEALRLHLTGGTHFVKKFYENIDEAINFNKKKFN